MKYAWRCQRKTVGWLDKNELHLLRILRARTDDLHVDDMRLVNFGKPDADQVSGDGHDNDDHDDCDDYDDDDVDDDDVNVGCR